jgi:hypothetical protein
MSAVQLTLTDGRFIVPKGKHRIAWVVAPKPDPNKLLFYRRVRFDSNPLYDMIEKVAPEISQMYPELKGYVIGLRVKPMSWCCACWDYHTDEIAFDSLPKTEWTEKEVGATFAHELTHAYEDKCKSIPSGEKATDLFMLSKVPLKYLVRPSYLECAKEPFELFPERIQELAREAIVKRNSGLRQYIRWFEDQVNKIYYDMKGEPMPKRTRFSWAAWKKEKTDFNMSVLKEGNKK